MYRCEIMFIYFTLYIVEYQNSEEIKLSYRLISG